MTDTLEGFVQEEHQSLIEYSLITSIMAIGTTFALWLMREQIIALFNVFRAAPQLTL